MPEKNRDTQREQLLDSIPNNIRFLVSSTLRAHGVYEEIGFIAKSSSTKVEPHHILEVLDNCLDDPSVDRPGSEPSLHLGYIEHRKKIVSLIESYSSESDKGMELLIRVINIF